LESGVRKAKSLSKSGSLNGSDFRASFTTQDSGVFKKEDSIAAPDNLSTKSTSRNRNYLPDLRRFLSSSNVRAKNFLEHTLEQPIAPYHKYEMLRAKTEQADSNASYLEKKIKYAKSSRSNECELAKEKLGEYYVESIQTKLAMLNDLC